MIERDRPAATIRVVAAPPPQQGYDIIVRAGALQELAERVAAVAPAARYVVIAPDDVACIYGERVLADLHATRLDATLFEFPAGEAHKTRETWASLTDRMHAARIGRDSCVIALGGGVTGDLAGFVAATYMRGVPVVQVPTTLLAMVDASIGGKTGVDSVAGKNLIGAFHAPRLVLADPLVLTTLPLREYISGMAETVKHGAILDRAYFDWLEANVPALLAQDAAVLERLVARSAELKAGVVMDDPYEHGMRAALNFGHTIGHALELQSNYALPHGHAVSIGMVAESAAGEAAGVTEAGTRERIAGLLQRLQLPVAASRVDVTALLDMLRLDKKARRARPRFAIPSRIGEIARPAQDEWTIELPEDALKHALARAISDARAV